MTKNIDPKTAEHESREGFLRDLRKVANHKVEKEEPPKPEPEKRSGETS